MKRIHATGIELKRCGEEGGSTLVALCSHSDDHVALSASVYALTIDEVTAVQTLERLATEDSMVGFTAGHALRGWREGAFRDADWT